MAMEDATLVKQNKQTFVLRSSTSGESYPLNGEMLVGREVECAIPINSGHVSRYHAKINVSPYGVYVEDLHSTNGTFVNGNKIKGRVRLSLGDEVAFDDILFRVTSTHAGREEATALALRKPQSHNSSPEMSAPASSRQGHAPLRPSRAQDSAPESQSVVNRIDELRDSPLDELDELDDIPLAEPAKQEPKIRPSAALENPAEPEARPAERADRKITPINPRALTHEELEEEDFDQDHTQLLSPSQLSALVEKHRNERELNLGSGPRLIVMTAPIRGKIFELQEPSANNNWQIGRDPQAHIYLNDKTISTDHARLAQDGNGEFILSANHAKNGIYVNGVLTGKARLHHGDKIQIGRTELTFKTDISMTPNDGQLNLETTQSLGSSRLPGTGILTGIFIILVLVAAVFITQ